MKKSLLSLTLIPFLSLASTDKNFIKTSIDTKSTFNSNFKYQDTDMNENISTEIQIKGTGLSIGANLEHRSQLSVFPYVLEPTGVLETLEKHLDFKDSHIYVNYKNGNFNTRVKLNKNLKLTTMFDYQNYTLPNIEFGVNSKSIFPLKKLNGFNPVHTTLKGFVQKDFGKFKDVRLDLETQHQIDKESTSLGFQYIMGTLSTRYTINPNLTLYGEAKMKYQFDNTYPIWSDDESIHVDCGHNHSHNNNYTDAEEQDIYSHFHGYRQGATEPFERSKDKKIIQNNKFGHSYTLGAKYRGIKDLQIDGKVKFYHGDNTEKGKPPVFEIIGLGALNLKYTGFKNWEINSSLIGFVELDRAETGVNTITKEIKNTTNVKYKYNVTDKLEVSPELQSTLNFRSSGNHALYITPKLNLTYNATNNLTLNASLEDAFAFSLHRSNKNYVELNNSVISTKLNLKYSW